LLSFYRIMANNNSWLKTNDFVWYPLVQHWLFSAYFQDIYGGNTLKRVFIANRGEICRRIAQSACTLGIETVCIVEVGKRPLYLQPVISAFYEVVSETPALYLDGDRMIAIAQEMGCDAVHPGFGFLSENGLFAEKVQQSGLLWIGPSPQVIRLMGDKAVARTYAEQAKLPCTQGLLIEDMASIEVQHFLKQIEGPLLLKAAKGGGGKGMRLVTDRSQLESALARARSEARTAFGDESMILEPYIEASRHVEAQILADHHGNVVILGDRDCSVQRRHQKVIEEAPAPCLSPKTRKKLHEAARRLAQEMGYTSLGTVEFLVDWSDKSQAADEQPFYFLEMNTRLQVEHPVTEEVWGLDLVEWQFRVARGEVLPDHFQRLQPRGHSLEVRLYAEDVEQSYLPASGPVYGFFPANSCGVRWEVGMDFCDTISTSFDPMVAKIVVHAETREACMTRMAFTLSHTFFFGSICNREFLYLLVTETSFTKGPVTTHFLEEVREAVLIRLQEEREKVKSQVTSYHPYFSFGSASVQLAKSLTVSSVTDQIFSVSGKPSHAVTSTESMEISWRHATGAHCQYAAVYIDGAICYGIRVDTLTGTLYGFQRKGFLHIERQEKENWKPVANVEALLRQLVAPVPGKVVKILVQEKEYVEAGVALLVIESMKIEFEIKAPRAGVVSQILVQPQQQITAGYVMLHMEGS
jgi:acetyl/propionyl-CoA carboxylase alpha subunit